jgi:hypothetical protein
MLKRESDSSWICVWIFLISSNSIKAALTALKWYCLFQPDALHQVEISQAFSLIYAA